MGLVNLLFAIILILGFGFFTINIRKIIRNIIEESYQDFLNEKIGDFNYNKTFPVPSDVVNIAKQAIASTGSKLEKAVELANGKVQTFNQIKKF
jgi:hypothetical protein